MTHTEMEVLLAGLKELKQDYHRIEEVELFWLDNVEYLTKHLEQGELSGESLKLFKDLREVTSPAWETVAILFDRLEVAQIEIENWLNEEFLKYGSKTKIKENA
ncbi:hypothetical protein [Shimazuella kribbensis]|uniref:hypothetical protein n=1 Tax=Shimazuella kribbensis TaxID=139808 RepID=UPI000417A541|nr:hypothetical protein [Shimazuella kribbensis]